MSINVPVLARRDEASWLGPKVAVVLVGIVLFSLAFAALEVRVGAVPLDSGPITSWILASEFWLLAPAICGGFLLCRPVLGSVVLRKTTCGASVVARIYSAQGCRPAQVGGAVPFGRRSCPAGRREAGASDFPAALISNYSRIA